MKIFVLAVALLVPLIGNPAGAQQKVAFLDAVERAYPSYKMAWFYSRTRGGDMATMELAAFHHAWGRIVEKFAHAPPPKFAADRQWGASLRKIAAVLDRAAAEADAGRLRECHRILGAVRTELAALRRRGGVVVFSDRVDSDGEVVTALTQLTRKMTAVRPADLVKLRGMSARMKKLVSKIRTGAPAKYRHDAGFLASVDGNEASIAKLDRGIGRKNVRAIVGAMRSIRSDYVLLFLRYG